MLPLTQLLKLGLLEDDPIVDEIVREDTASGEEAAVDVQGCQGNYLRACPVGMLFLSRESTCSSKPFHNANLDSIV